MKLILPAVKSGYTLCDNESLKLSSVLITLDEKQSHLENKFTNSYQRLLEASVSH